MRSSPGLGTAQSFLGASGPLPPARIACSAARWSSSPWMENFTMLRFMLSHASTERRSAMRLSTSFGSNVGIAMPGSDTPRLPHSRRYISNGSCGGGVSSAMRGFFGRREELLDLRLAADGVLVAQIDERAAERLLEEQVARQVRSRAVERAGRLQDEAHRRRQLVQEARRDALDRLRRRDEQHL